jgi:putative Holliday junction resolvase
VPASIPRAGRILAVDWGERRFGIAVSDESQIIATPVATLTRRPGKRFPMPALLEVVAAQQAVGVVVGLPLTSEGQEAGAAGQARALAERIERRTVLPVELVDERMTTARAHAAIREQGGSARGRKGDVDALSAAVLLQGFLERRRNDPGR